MRGSFDAGQYPLARSRQLRLGPGLWLEVAVVVVDSHEVVDVVRVGGSQREASALDASMRQGSLEGHPVTSSSSRLSVRRCPFAESGTREHNQQLLKPRGCRIVR